MKFVRFVKIEGLPTSLWFFPHHERKRESNLSTDMILFAQYRSLLDHYRVISKMHQNVTNFSFGFQRPKSTDLLQDLLRSQVGYSFGKDSSTFTDTYNSAFDVLRSFKCDQNYNNITTEYGSWSTIDQTEVEDNIE